MLYQKYRPDGLAAMIGNATMLAAIQKHFSLPPESRSHAHIITGPSGCGKTTLGRIIAYKLLGANELSYHEINTAENRGIDTIREIIENMRKLPIGGGSSVYLIDEAHGLSKDAKRALLKPLEDCPRHVYFFLCTTDPQELFKGDEGKAIKTRCPLWEVRDLTSREIGKVVAGIAAKENYKPSDRVFDAIVSASEGSPRAAINALELVMSSESDDSAIALLSHAALDDDPQVFTFTQALLRKAPWDQLIQVLAPLKGMDTEKLRRSVTGIMAASLMRRWDAQAAIVLDRFSVPTYDNGWPGIVSASAYCVMTMLATPSQLRSR